jgi:hypothetical protein
VARTPRAAVAPAVKATTFSGRWAFSRPRWACTGSERDRGPAFVLGPKGEVRFLFFLIIFSAKQIPGKY